ncbi:MAG: 23S rRNA (guanosine(2251)-2'-O)-methyltransferase RlmB [Bacilli bacterium]|nr:23S rRNA (guanosine(2251)-2'-O)-methyltransferase RlmB [Bacillales bacterium]MDY2574760.1 23S rRNA (guanosine(2251)-2'-O)-methyltransferase RlmB [Bacilli bacterium]
MKKNYIFGKNTLANALEHNSSLKNVYVTSSFKDERIFSLLKKKNIPFKIVSNKEISSFVGNVNHQGIVGEVEDYKYLSLEELIKKNENNPNALLVVLDGIEDPHNFGAILRSVDAFGASGVIIGANRQVGLNSTVAKVSTGAIEYVDTCMVVNLNQTIKTLKDNGYWIVASDGEAKDDYRSIDYNTKIALIVGSEGFGVSKLLLKNSDFIVKIPMVGHVNSLNASVACALFLAQIYNRRNPL